MQSILKYITAEISYYWHLIALSLILLAVWSLYRLYKRWIRRCEHCGSMKFVRWHERQLVQITHNGRGDAISTTHQMCLNRGCSHYREVKDVKSYVKEFPLRMMTS